MDRQPRELLRQSWITGSDRLRKLCVLPVYYGVSGPASFRTRFIQSLNTRGIEVVTNPLSEGCGAVLVIGGTRRLDALWRCKTKGMRIIQRLDGMNWIHRIRWTGVRHFLRSEVNNLILAWIRRFFADEIIYQSRYVYERWNERFGGLRKKSTVIHNGVDLSFFKPSADLTPPSDRVRIACVEGNWRGGHEISLRNAVLFAEAVQRITLKPVELVIAGKVDAGVREKWQHPHKIDLHWAGVLPTEEVIRLDCTAHFFFSAEVNAPCPNSVIEALACGCPVVAFRTGSLPELVVGDAGRLVPYGSSYAWLGAPDVDKLALAAVEILSDQDRFRQAARARAEAAFDLAQVVQRYLEICFPS